MKISATYTEGVRRELLGRVEGLNGTDGTVGRLRKGTEEMR